MGLLDRFKKKKEQELQGASAPAVSASAKEAKKPEAAKKGKAAPKAEEKKAEAKAVKVVRAETARVIISPVVTEKAAQLSATNTYVFRVDPRATRVQVRAAFKELYGIQPTKVNITNMRREVVRFGRSMGKQSAWKKALVTIPKGKEIHIYEGV